MFTFTFMLLPLAVIYYYLNSEKKHSLLTICLGVLSGFMVFAVKEFFSHSHRIIPYSFSENFLFLFFSEAFFPVMVLFAVYFFISKDSVDFKLREFFPLTASFYCVYVPYIVLISPESKTAFEIFAKPILFLSMLSSITIGIEMIIKKTSPKVFIPSGCALILISLMMPSITEALFLTYNSTWICALLTFISVIVPAFLYLFPGFQIFTQKKHLTD